MYPDACLYESFLPDGQGASFTASSMTTTLFKGFLLIEFKSLVDNLCGNEVVKGELCSSLSWLVFLFTNDVNIFGARWFRGKNLRNEDI